MTHRLRDAVAAVVGVGLVVPVALIVHPNMSPGWEQAIFHVVNSMPDILYWPLWLVMQLGNLVALPVAAAVAAALRRFRLALALLCATAAKIYFARLVKDLVTRQRPASVIAEVTRRGDASASGEAFVSGHAIVVFALATLVTPYLSRRGRVIVWTAAVLVCVGRVYVGAHLPLDAVGGGLIGCAIGSALSFVVGAPVEPSERPRDPSRLR